VFYQPFTVSFKADYVIEFISPDYFDSFMYLFRDDGELEEGDVVDWDDDGDGCSGDDENCDWSKIERTLAPGNYLLAVAGRNLTLLEALAGSNDNRYDYGDFEFAIAKHMQPPETTMLRIIYADGVPADALGQVSVGLKVWGQEGSLNVSGAEDPAGANGVYLEDRIFNGYAAYRNENGYWIFWDDGPDGGDGHEEWDLTATLGGDELWYTDDLVGEWSDGDGYGAISATMKYGDTAITVPVEPDPQPVVEIGPGLPETINLEVGQALDIPLTLSDPGHNTIGVQYVLDADSEIIAGEGSLIPAQ